MKLISWNVNGIRAVAKKVFLKSVKQMSPDIICLQETKAQDVQVEEALAGLDGYHLYSNSAVKKGYAGTAVLSRTEPLGITRGIDRESHDSEGRALSLEYENFYLVNVYVPNSGSELKRLGYRQEWDRDFYDYLKKLEEKKPVIACGDFNVAHKEIDLARPKPNYNKSAGFMQEEIDGMDRYAAGGFVDTFRYLYPGKRDAYSWWSYRAGARGKNVGWRIDYILVSDKLIPLIKKASIHNDIMGSDHCPVSVEIE
ncbi:MAG: exodeoxyribonuclease III, partial [Bacteroidales bacterium]